MGGPVDDAVGNDAAGMGSIRERRTSAVAAAAAFRAVIAAQDAAMTTTTMGGYGSSRPRTRGGKDEANMVATMAGGAWSNVGRANIVGLGGKNAGGGMRTGPTTPGRRPKEARMEEAGYRLSDSRPFAGSSSPSVPSRKYGKADRGGCATMGVGAFRSEDDIANRLLSLLGGGGDGEATVGGTWADTSDRR